MTIVALLAVLGGCERRAAPLAAPTIYYGQDICSKCSMIISEDRYAASIGIRKDGRTEYFIFDDLGEMLAFSLPPHDEVRRWVYDAGTLAVLDAEAAVYVRSPDLRTPMATGVAAYATRDDANAVAEEYDGNVMDLAALLADDPGAPIGRR